MVATQKYIRKVNMTSMLEKSEIEQLNKALPVIMAIWFALICSLAVYVGVAKFMEDKLPSMEEGFPLATMNTIFSGLAVVILIAAHFIRKTMLNPARTSVSMMGAASSGPAQHPAAAKYMVAMIVSLALSESVGVCGLVLFILGRETSTLYAFMALSAVAMFYFRPKKEELMDLALEMKMQGSGRRG